ncbi:MAG: hypothetical protein AVDCRST_MAG55-2678, partial [uncultured Rubrobacteraceae bacterium]
ARGRAPRFTEGRRRRAGGGGLYCVCGEAGVHAGHDPGRRERLGRLAPLLQLRAPALHAPGPPRPLLRAAAEGLRGEGARAVPRLLGAAGGGCLVHFRRALPGAPRPGAAARVLPAASRSVPPWGAGGPVRVRGYLAGAGLPVRFPPAAGGGAGPAVGGAGVGRRAACAPRHREGPRGAGVAGGRARHRGLGGAGRGPRRPGRLGL